MAEPKRVDSGAEGSPERSSRLYILLAVVLVIVIAIIGYLLVTLGIPALRGDDQPSATQSAVMTATPVPTFTPAPTKEPTNTPPPSPTPTSAPPVMADTDDPSFVYQSAGARPSTEWTGFFGQVSDTNGDPLGGVNVAVWYRDGQLAAPVATTDETGHYEIRLAEGPLAGTWTIQVLTEGLQPASNLFTFQTDEDTQQGIQQIQVLWAAAP
jgi:hypothetical protein